MELIRPLYRIREEDVIAWARYNDLHFIQCACRFTENSAQGSGSSKRQETKSLIRELKKTNPDIERSIFNAVHSVRLDTFPAYKAKERWHTFLERYDERPDADS